METAMTDPSNDIAASLPAPTKKAIVIRLLSRSRGATSADMIEATGWQAHTVRAFLTGQRKKGIALRREQRRDGTTCYRIAKTVTTVEQLANLEAVDA
jgi:hypothetical protein